MVDRVGAARDGGASGSRSVSPVIREMRRFAFDASMIKSNPDFGGGTETLDLTCRQAHWASLSNIHLGHVPPVAAPVPPRRHVNRSRDSRPPHPHGPAVHLDR